MTYNGKDYHAFYSNFTFSPETQGYKLSVSGYSGTAGNSHNRVNNNQKFSTFDKDNDKYINGNCAVSYKAAWWYNQCHYTNLNGLWGCNRSSEGLNWYDVTGINGSVSRSEMKIRPVSP
ncbi:tenascin-R-like [Physella acuta]|uniref:tenascin-R-like n=1 Tax=Physella acuta TaxID=109671 RepID=UPI0027DC2785|nr:tenascin-R-like [Physella acuta]